MWSATSAMRRFYSRWMIPGIVLAAGKSSRMGRTKALLEIGTDTFLTRVVRTLADAGVEEIVVVVGGDADAIRASAADRSLAVRFVDNPDFEQGQLSSL